MGKRGLNKKGFEMIWSTWVVMILAIILAVFLILFFTLWSGNFLDNIKGFFSKTNVDSVVKGCNILVQSGDNYNFCCDKKEVKYLLDGKLKTMNFACSELVDKDFVSGINSLDCLGINCGNSITLDENSCNSSGGRWNPCGSICSIMNPGAACPAVCDSVCECGTILGLLCPPGYVCAMPPGIADAMGYCSKERS